MPEDLIVDQWWEYFTLAAAAGVLSSAVIQILKELLVIRSWYHQHRFKKWVKDRCCSGACGDCVYSKVMTLCGNDDMAILGQRTVDLIRQFRLIAQLSLAFPEKYEHILRVFTGFSVEDFTKYKEFLAKQQSKSEINVPGVGDDNDDIYRRASVLLDSRLTGMEVSFSHWWELGIKLFASTITAVVVYIVTDYNGFAALWIGLIGGLILAPVSHNIVGAVSALRIR